MIVLTNELTQVQQDLLIGTLLGDGHLATKTQGRTWYYDIKHSMAQEDYLNYKYEILRNFCKKNPYRYNSRSPVSCNFVVYFRFWTRSYSFLAHYGNMFYFYNEDTKRYKKNVPKNIKEYLTPRSIAFWYMDDGYLFKKADYINIVLCTDSFSLDAIYRLKDVFENIYNIKISLVPRKEHKLFSGYRIYIYSKDAITFCNLVRPYIIPSMLYKLNNV